MRGEKGMSAALAVEGYIESRLNIMISPSRNITPFSFNILYSPVFIPLVSFAILFAVCFIGSKLRHKAYQKLGIILTLCVAASLYLYNPIPGSVAISYLSQAFVLTATVFIINFVK
jgi:FtsH-binding integral membrane protein